jgi:hypothetical protein
MSLDALEKYLPYGTLESVSTLVRDCSVLIRIKDERKTKYGDYRPLGQGWKHQITINNNLNPYAFLVTLLHEIAHLQVQERFGNRVKPHGEEWQHTYSTLLKRYLNKGYFPQSLEMALVEHINRPSATSCTDLDLFKALRKHDRSYHAHTHVEDIPEGGKFVWRDNQVFVKGSKMRTRYRCNELKSGRVYFFHPLAEVEKLN